MEPYLEKNILNYVVGIFMTEYDPPDQPVNPFLVGMHQEFKTAVPALGFADQVQDGLVVVLRQKKTVWCLEYKSIKMV